MKEGGVEVRREFRYRVTTSSNDPRIAPRSCRNDCPVICNRIWQGFARIPSSHGQKG